MKSDGGELPLDIKGVLDGSHAFQGPEQIVVDITNRCNNNCIGCWTNSPLLREKDPGPLWRMQEIPGERLMSLVDECAQIDVRRIRFTGGGEPLLHKQCLPALEKIKSKGMAAALTTNFTLANNDAIDHLVDMGIDEIAISVWAASPKSYSRVHPNKTEKTFKRLKENISRLSTLKGDHTRVTISNVLLSMNYHEAIEMYQMAVDVGADALYFTLIDPIQGYTDGLLLQPEQARMLHRDMEIVGEMNETNKQRVLELENFQEFLRRLRFNDPVAGKYDLHTVDNIPCYVGWIFCRILPNGNVCPCCRGVPKSLGNLNQHSFTEIWYSTVYDEFRRKAKILPKSDPYFKEIDCYTTCDNLMHNLQMHKRVQQFSAFERISPNNVKKSSVHP